MEGFESFIGVNPWTALFTLLNFLLVFFVGKKFLFGPVMKIIADRQKEIDDMYDSANKASQQAKALEDEYQSKLSQAKRTSDEIVKNAVARAQAREDEIIRQANADAATILEKANADIAQEKKKALNDAKDEISGVAMAIAEKVVARQLNEVDQQTLIAEFIDNLGESL